MRPHLTVEQRQLALRLKARGWSLREIGPQVDCVFQTVAVIARRGSRRPAHLDGWVPGPGRLTLADREEIILGLHAGQSFTVIAARLGKAVSTVSREVAANGGRGGYRAWRAHQRARAQAPRSGAAGRECELPPPPLPGPPPGPKQASLAPLTTDTADREKPWLQFGLQFILVRISSPKHAYLI